MASFKKLELDSGETRWRARVHRRGAATVTRRFRTREAAETWARSVESKLDKGELAPSRTTSSVTIATAIDAFLKAHTVPTKQLGAYKTVRFDLGSLAVKSLTRAHVERWLAVLAKTKVPPRGPNGTPKETCYSASTRRKFYFSLKSALEWHAAKTGYSLPGGLFSQHKVPGSWENQQNRRVTKAEEKALLAAAATRNAQWPLAIGFALETACRLQEILLNEWRFVAPTGDSLFVPKAICKTDHDRPVPLSLPARAIIKQLRGRRKAPTGRIFHALPLPEPASEEFGYIADDAKCPDVTFHTLRHEATSRLAESGLFALYELMAITGHSSLHTFSRYLHLLPSSLAKRFDQPPRA